MDLFGPLERALERGLDIAHMRHQLTASNLANVDTPGYKPRHLAFEQALEEAVAGSPRLALKTNEPRHLEPAEAVARIEVDEIARRTDGNAVDPEREMADLQENGIRYAVLTQVLVGRLRSLRNAINEGRQ